MKATNGKHALSFPKLAATPVEAPQKGKLVYDEQIPDAFLGGLPGIEDKVRWVRRHLPKEKRIKIGRASAWWESDIRAWLEGKKSA